MSDTTDEKKADHKKLSPLTELTEATKLLSVRDIYDFPKYPCARQSLLLGIASGAGVFGLRLLRANSWVAGNWAVGTFVFVSLASWEFCQTSRKKELETMRTIVERFPDRHVKVAQKRVQEAKRREQGEQGGAGPAASG